MGNKRITLGDSKSKYALIAGGAILTITSLFIVLIALGFQITGSDDVCLGTADDPCISYGKICNLGPDNYDIYNPDNVKLDFSPTIKNYWMFFKDGRMKKEMLYSLGVNASTSGWRYENFTNATKVTSTAVYVHRFGKYSCQDYMIVGLKENPNDVIKWGFGVKDEYLDPFWYGVGNATANISATTIYMELGSQINITANITGAATTCVDVDHPSYGINYTCGTPSAKFLFNISYFRNKVFNDSIDYKNLSWINGGNQTFYIRANHNDEIINVSFNVTGFITNNTYPTGVKVYINNSLSNNLGYVYSGNITLNHFSDNSTKELLYFEGYDVQTLYIKIPFNAEVTSATFNMTGLESSETYTGEHFNLGSWGNNDSEGMDMNSTNIFIIEDEEKEIYVYDKYGEYIYKIDLASTGITNPQSVTINNTFMWITDNGVGKVFKLTMAGVYVSNFSVPEVHSGSLTGISNDETYIYVTDVWDYYVRKYWINGTYTGEYFDMSGELSNPQDLTIDGNYIYVSTNFDGVYRYYKNGTYTGWHMSTYYDPGNYGIANDGQYFWVNNYALDAVYKHYMIRYPINPYMSIGVNKTWNYTGEFNTSIQTNSFHDILQEYISDCTADSEGYCTIPIYLVGSEGWINITSIKIDYISNLNPVFLSNNLIELFLINSTGDVDIPIKIETLQNGTITFNDLRYDYAGGNKTINVTVWQSTNKSNNQTLQLINYFSNWENAFPSHVNYLEFIPKSSTAKNVTPYGQTIIRPIFNITNTGYGGMESNFSISINESYTCVNLTVSTNSNKSSGVKLNSSWLNVQTNFAQGENFGMWMWADYSCNYSSWKLWEPKLSLRNCCENCVCSEDR